MISGAHAILYSHDAERDRAFFRDVLGFKSVDSGGGWLIFALPPAEVAFHPADAESHELFLMSDDVKKEVAALKAKGVVCEEIKQARWGLLTRIQLPSGAWIGLYQAKHARP
jgi:catechol 2,3-dioxygenase-like lactoylglutathione lyase family enzyme